MATIPHVLIRLSGYINVLMHKEHATLAHVWFMSTLNPKTITKNTNKLL